MASTVPYFAYRLRLIVRQDSPITSWQQLAGKTVGVLKDTAADRYLRERYGNAIDLRAVYQHARCVNRLALVLSAPHRDGVEVLERESDRLEDLMARIAGRIRVVRFHGLPHRGRLRISGRIRRPLLDCRHVWRRIRRTDTEERLQEPLPARHR